MQEDEMREIAVMKRVNHPHCVQLFEVAPRAPPPIAAAPVPLIAAPVPAMVALVPNIATSMPTTATLVIDDAEHDRTFLILELLRVGVPCRLIVNLLFLSWPALSGNAVGWHPEQHIIQKLNRIAAAASEPSNRTLQSPPRSIAGPPALLHVSQGGHVMDEQNLPPSMNYLPEVSTWPSAPETAPPRPLEHAHTHIHSISGTHTRKAVSPPPPSMRASISSAVQSGRREVSQAGRPSKAAIPLAYVRPRARARAPAPARPRPHARARTHAPARPRSVRALSDRVVSIQLRFRMLVQHTRKRGFHGSRGHPMLFRKVDFVCSVEAQTCSNRNCRVDARLYSFGIEWRTMPFPCESTTTRMLRGIGKLAQKEAHSPCSPRRAD
eukprot:6179175-Pleurochrysis_carterae.AAC.3